MSYEENNEEFEFNEFGDGDEFSEDDEDDMELDPLAGSFLRGAIPSELLTKWKETEFNLKMNEINLSVLRTAVSIASNSWFWRVRSVDSKMKTIVRAYYTLNNLIDNNSIYTE